MRIGVVFPQTEFGNDPIALRDYVQTVEGLGFSHFLAYDHVLGADTSVRPGWSGPYTSQTPFHEIFVLFGYVAALTERLELVSGVLILPQRQTALVAKQAAAIDVLSNGRMRLGIGVGWNEVEYDGLDKAFANRGARSEEQIALMRVLWEQPLVTFEGRFHRLERCCINPRPARRIPIFAGGFSEAAFRRGGTLCDGFTFAGDVDAAVAGMERVEHYLEVAGRDASTFPRELIMTRARTPQQVVETASRWQEVGGTGVSVLTQKVGLPTIEAHLEYLAEVKDALGRAFGSGA